MFALLLNLILMRHNICFFHNKSPFIRKNAFNPEWVILLCLACDQNGKRIVRTRCSMKQAEVHEDQIVMHSTPIVPICTSQLNVFFFKKNL